MRTDPAVRRDGLCSYRACSKPRPAIAVENDDPFCTTLCCRAYHKIRFPSDSKPLQRTSNGATICPEHGPKTRRVEGKKQKWLCLPCIARYRRERRATDDSVRERDRERSRRRRAAMTPEQRQRVTEQRMALHRAATPEQKERRRVTANRARKEKRAALRALTQAS